MTKTVGWVGPGIMGLPMLHRLAAAGYATCVHARAPERRAALAAEGFTVTGDVGDLHGCEVVVTMLPGPPEVRELVLGNGGLLAGLRPGAMLIDMSTSSPKLAVEIAAAADERGVSALDAPVSGGPVGAGNGTLSIMVGGAPEAFAAAGGLFSRLGTVIVHHGGPGGGQRAKLLNQILVGATSAATAEVFALAGALGLDAEDVRTSIRAGAAGSGLFDFLWGRLASGDRSPGFRVEHMLKDLELAVEAGAAAGGPLAVTEPTRQLFAEATRLAPGDGTQTVVDALSSRSSE